MIWLSRTKMIVYMRRWFSSEGHWWESPSHIHNHLCFCRTYHENCWWNISFRAISNQNTNFNFQGCHIYGNLANFKLNWNPDQKKNIRFFIFMVKNLLNLYFVFQGSQKRHVRVAISFETLVNFFWFLWQINGHSMPECPVYSDFTVTFPTLRNALWWESVVNRLRG